MREGRKMQVMSDYIFHGKKIKWVNFNMIGIGGFDSDHPLLKGIIDIQNNKPYRKYLWSQKFTGFDIFNLTRDPSAADSMFHELHEAVGKSEFNSTNRSWISKEMFQLLALKAKHL